jgi:hypothetical protein
MTHEENPGVQQRRLRAELRKIREDAGLHLTDVTGTLEWPVSKLIRIETGAASVTTTDLIALLHYYAVKEQKRVDELVELARSVRQAAWWDKYRDRFDSRFINFLAYEASARLVRQFHALAVPGVLQTREYAQAQVRSFGVAPELINFAVNLRMERQRVLEREKPPEFFFVIDEAVLRRWVGGPRVMRQQLLRLKVLNWRRYITIQIARFNVGAYAGVKGSFTVFEFPHQEEDYAVLLEHADRDELIQNDPELASRFLETFFELETIAAPASETDGIIDEVLATIPKEQPPTIA